MAFHSFNDFDTRYTILEGIRRSYDGPLTGYESGFSRTAHPCVRAVRDHGVLKG